MTQNTDQERAEFEAWSQANNKYHVSGYNPHNDLWEAWQAARSAPAAPEPVQLDDIDVTDMPQAFDLKGTAMTYDEIKAAWNAQADEHNHWDSLGEDEKIEWAFDCAACLNVVTSDPMKALKLIANSENSALDLAYCKGIARAAIANAQDGIQRAIQEDGWIQDGYLLYRLTNEPKPRNRDEISVTMVNGSRAEAARTKRASEILNVIRAAQIGKV